MVRNHNQVAVHFRGPSAHIRKPVPLARLLDVESFPVVADRQYQPRAFDSQLDVGQSAARVAHDVVDAFFED
jgi:hypothetical protein